jgi:hypothetical protein
MALWRGHMSQVKVLPIARSCAITDFHEDWDMGSIHVCPIHITRLTCVAHTMQNNNIIETQAIKHKQN